MTCARCEQEGTCPQHLTTIRFLRRARQAGQPDPEPEPPGEYFDAARARQWRVMNAPEQHQPPAVASPGRALTQEEITWNVRGEPRTRATFSQPHPADFPGGLPIPPECPLP